MSNIINEIKDICKNCNINVCFDHIDEQNIETEFEKARIIWDVISKYQTLSEAFITRYANKLSWWHLPVFQNLPIHLIEKNINVINFKNLAIYQNLSEEFIEKYSDRFGDWSYLSQYQKLSEAFMEKHADKLCWYFVSSHQKLSEKFIEKYADKLTWRCIVWYQKLSPEFIAKHNLTIDHETNWLYWTKEQKLEYLKKNCPQYEIVNDEYIVAYKSTKIDGHSTFNFQYKYEVGKTYNAHCDCNSDNSGSFGLSAWTKERALHHNNEGLLFEVHINIDDLGTVVQEYHKLRCHKLTIYKQCNVETNNC